MINIVLGWQVLTRVYNLNGNKYGGYRTTASNWSLSHSLSARAADLNGLLSPVLVLLDHFPSQSDCVQVIERLLWWLLLLLRLLLLLLLAAVFLSLHLSQWVDHGHVNIQVVGLLETFPTNDTRKLQVSLCLVLGHVVFKRCPLATLEATHLTSNGKRNQEHL